MIFSLNNSIHLDAPFPLDRGAILPGIEIAFNTYGVLNADRTNAVLMLHALTGSTDAHEWWSGLLGSGKAIDPEKYFIIVPNLLGSCYGTTGPESFHPVNGKPYLASFPTITIRDMARVNFALLDKLGIDRLQLAIAGSLGGMVVLEMAAIAPKRLHAIAPMAVSGNHSAWRLAFSSYIRKAIIALDPSLQDRAKLTEGLRLARQAAMITYRSSDEFNARFGRGQTGTSLQQQAGTPAPRGHVVPRGIFQVESYLEHQGEKLAARFSPYSYLTLTRAMELYDLSEGRGSIENVIDSIRCHALFVGISSDMLYSTSEIEQFASLFPNGRYKTLHAIHGHDSFLVDAEAIGNIIRPWLRELESASVPKRTYRIREEALAA